MKKLPIFLLAVCIMIGTAVSAQVTKVPQTAKDNFEKQYPAAQNVEWSNDVLSASVTFTLNDEKMNAEYSNKGIWKSTYKETSFENLPDAVKNGFRLSKYSDREVSDVKTVYYPGDVIQYRVKVDKNDVQKKYLFFNTEGKLLRDAITL
ncbi:MAG: PepSY-like domain-containing protein [Ferruginibacter sp.]